MSGEKNLQARTIFCIYPRSGFSSTNAFISFIDAFISIADTFIPAKERGFSTADTIISASDTSLVATEIGFPVAERILGDHCPAGSASIG